MGMGPMSSNARNSKTTRHLSRSIKLFVFTAIHPVQPALALTRMPTTAMCSERLAGVIFEEVEKTDRRPEAGAGIIVFYLGPVTGRRGFLQRIDSGFLDQRVAVAAIDSAR